MRQLSIGRRTAFAIGKPLLKLIFLGLWKTCRIRPVLGAGPIQELLAKGEPFIPCYWHQRHIFCTYYMFQLHKRGLKLGFLVSPSVDGEVPAEIMREWGAQIVRGSHTRTGAQALRDLFQLIRKDKVSPVNTPDGPTGPLHELKAGTVKLAQITQVPIVPLSYAAKHVWMLKTWDRFMIPMPFTEIQIAIGDPQRVPAKLTDDEFEVERQRLEAYMQATDRQAEAVFTAR